MEAKGPCRHPNGSTHFRKVKGATLRLIQDVFKAPHDWNSSMTGCIFVDLFALSQAAHHCRDQFLLYCPGNFRMCEDIGDCCSEMTGGSV